MPPSHNLQGKTVHRWKFLSRTDKRNSAGQVFWNVECQCRTKAVRTAVSIVSGQSKSCGCYKLEVATKHGKSKTPEFTVWQMMIQRCTNNKHKSYPRYGGRGITVCQRWLDSFENFLSDVGIRPSVEHTLDRIKNHIGYQPDNCKWATPLEQGQNKCNNRLITHNGLTLTESEWCRRIGLSKGTISRRIKSGYSVEQAMSKQSNRGIRRE